MDNKWEQLQVWLQPHLHRQGFLYLLSTLLLCIKSTKVGGGGHCCCPFISGVGVIPKPDCCLWDRTRMLLPWVTSWFRFQKTCIQFHPLRPKGPNKNTLSKQSIVWNRPPEARGFSEELTELPRFTKALISQPVKQIHTCKKKEKTLWTSLDFMKKKTIELTIELTNSPRPPLLPPPQTFLWLSLVSRSAATSRGSECCSLLI